MEEHFDFFEVLPSSYVAPLILTMRKGGKCTDEEVMVQLRLVLPCHQETLIIELAKMDQTRSSRDMKLVEMHCN
jgi:hypothetical protein